MAHETTVDTVKQALQSIEPHHNAEFFQVLLDLPYNVPLTTDSEATRRNFGPNEADYPVLGQSQSPFKEFPPIKDVQGMLQEEIDKISTKEGGLGSLQIYWLSTEDMQEDMTQAKELITNIANGGFETDGCIRGVPCPSIEKFCDFQPLKDSIEDGTFDWPTSYSILQRRIFTGLENHPETISFTTLLTGTVVWMIWPPTDENLGTLQAAYEAFSKDLDVCKLDQVAGKLVGGVYFVQNEGEGLRCPPFCPMLRLATKTAVLVEHSVISGEPFIGKCKKIPFYKSWLNTEVRGARSEQLWDNFGKNFLFPLEEILNGNLEHADRVDMDNLRYPLTLEGPLLSLLGAWDGIKEDVPGVVNGETAEKIKDAWKEFLNRSRTLKCLICGAECRRERNRDRNAHFEKMHWTAR